MFTLIKRCLQGAAERLRPREWTEYALLTKHWVAVALPRPAIDKKGERCQPIRKIIDPETGERTYSYANPRARFIDRSKYTPHQGAKERARRVRQAARGMIQ